MIKIKIATLERRGEYLTSLQIWKRLTITLRWRKCPSIYGWKWVDKGRNIQLGMWAPQGTFWSNQGLRIRCTLCWGQCRRRVGGGSPSTEEGDHMMTEWGWGVCPATTVAVSTFKSASGPGTASLLRTCNLQPAPIPSRLLSFWLPFPLALVLFL